MNKAVHFCTIWNNKAVTHTPSADPTMADEDAPEPYGSNVPYAEPFEMRDVVLARGPELDVQVGRAREPLLRARDLLKQLRSRSTSREQGMTRRG